jgi:large subunit ribosomal protein L25
MKTVEIIGFKRANLGKAESKRLRDAGNVPCVIYGGKDHVHFHVPMILFRDIIYTKDACLVNVDVEGTIYKAKLQEAQYHPVSEVILHADFLQVFDDKEVIIDIPVTYTGTSAGVLRGGRFAPKLKTLRVKATPNKMPDTISIDITNMEIGDSFKVGQLSTEGLNILNNPLSTICSVVITRAVKTEDAAAEKK